jgi:hypothetical protein
MLRFVSLANEWNGSGTCSFDVPKEVVFLYYFLPEIAGSTFMLYLLRIPRTKRVQANVQHEYKIV